MTLDGLGAAADPRIGTTLGGYRIDGLAGRGAMGVVYRAWDPSLDRPVALKVLPPSLGDDEAFRQRFLRETRLAAAIDHPNIIPIYEAGDDGGVLFLVMRLVDGVDLERRLAGGPLDVAQTVGLLGPVARALDVAHTRGLVHRDVKPANILVGDDPSGTPSVYLTDFGLTKQRASQSGLTRTGSFLGTVEYMAPEQIEGRPIDGATDQYALAATAFRCLTGRVPFERDTAIAMAMAHLKEPPPRVSTFRSDIPADVDAVIAKGLAKDPAARFASCREMLGALDRAGTVVAPVRTRTNRRPLATAVALLVVLVIAGSVVASGALNRSSTPTPSPVAIGATSRPAASPTATPSSTPFWTAAEHKLLDALPADIPGTCKRGNANVDLPAAGFTGNVHGPNGDVPLLPQVTTLAIVECTPPGGLSAWFTWYALTPGSPPADAVGRIGQSFGVPAGDCAKPPARRAWETSTGASGVVMCLKDTGPGRRPWIYWSFGAGHGLGVATAPAGQYDSLYTWWQRFTLFVP